MLFRSDQVPAGLYTAVAEVMAYVYQLNQYMASNGSLLPPQAPSVINVPADLDPGAPDELQDQHPEALVAA